jgi:hypothetical protein
MALMSPEEADAYRKPVLDALGADDPFEVQEAEFEAWQRMVEAAGEDLRGRPAHEEWSVVELLGHMTDSEMVTSVRYRWVLAEDRPALPGYDQEAWTAQFNHRSDDPELLLTLFGALRLAMPSGDPNRSTFYSGCRPATAGCIWPRLRKPLQRSGAANRLPDRQRLDRRELSAPPLAAPGGVGYLRISYGTVTAGRIGH